MHDSTSSVYRIDGEPSKTLAVVRGSLPRNLRKLEARKLIQREAHALVLAATDDGIPVDRYDWWADLRRGRLKMMGGLLRFIDSLIGKGFPESKVQMIPGWISAYSSEQFSDRNPDPPTANAA